MERSAIRWHVVWMIGAVLWLLLAAAFLVFIPASVVGRPFFLWGSTATGLLWLIAGVLARRRPSELGRTTPDRE
jgi:hypothetical protein